MKEIGSQCSKQVSARLLLNKCVGNVVLTSSDTCASNCLDKDVFFTAMHYLRKSCHSRIHQNASEDSIVDIEDDGNLFQENVQKDFFVSLDEVLSFMQGEELWLFCG